MTALPGPSEPLDISFNEDALATLTAAFRQYGDAFRIFSPTANSHICVFSHPDHVRRVFVDNNGNYTKQPTALKYANIFFGLATSGGTQAYYKQAPTREAADKLVAARFAAPGTFAYRAAW